jgi:hypothetical protein
MKKIGLICLAVVLTLGIAGVGFGWWSETLTIGGDPINTGNFLVTFDNGGGGDGWTSPETHETVHLRGVVSNDDATNDHAIWCNGNYLDPVVPDPDDDGGDPTAEQTMEAAVNRIDNVASTQASIDFSSPPDSARQLTVTISNAYPSYWPTVFFSIRNWGTIPAKVQSIRVIEVSVGGTKTPVNIPLAACVPVYLDCDNDGDDDLRLHISDDESRLYQVMTAGSGVYGQHGYYESAVCGNLDIHVEDGADENTTYDFTVEIVAVPFNG